MKVKGKVRGAYTDIHKKSVIEFEVEDCNIAALNKELESMGELNIDIKKYRAKRSLDANAYFWVLVDKLSQVTGYNKTEIYKNAIKEIGGVSDTICVTNKAVDKLRESWSQNGLGWQTDTLPSKIDGCTNVILYYGSSTYNSKQMSLLIDNIVQDCQSVGIETLTPTELERLKASWKEANNE